MVSNQGLGLRYVEGYGLLRLAIAKHLEAACGFPWWGGGVRSLGYPTELRWHYQCLAADYLDPPTSIARGDVDAVWRDHDGQRPPTVHVERKKPWWIGPAKGHDEATPARPRFEGAKT